MATQYHIYSNSGSGGPIDWSTPIATVSALTWTSGALAASSAWRFGVRAFDTVTGLEDASVDAQVAITLDSLERDISFVPPAPAGVSARPLASGGYRVEWAWTSAVRPTGYHVYIGTPTPDYSAPAGTVAYSPIRPPRFDGSGLTDGITYQVDVRAYTAAGDGPGGNVASFTADATPPTAVDSLAGSAAH